MATMTHPSTMMPRARNLHRAPAATNIQAEVGEMKGSLLYSIGMTIGILGVSLASVLMPAFGPPSAEASALIEAQEVQAAAHSWVVMHPEDAVPTGDARAWGFVDPNGASSADDASCAQYWAGSLSAC